MRGHPLHTLLREEPPVLTSSIILPCWDFEVRSGSVIPREANLRAAAECFKSVQILPVDPAIGVDGTCVGSASKALFCAVVSKVTYPRMSAVISHLAQAPCAQQPSLRILSETVPISLETALRREFLLLTAQVFHQVRAVTAPVLPRCSPISVVCKATGPSCHTVAPAHPDICLSGKQSIIFREHD